MTLNCYTAVRLITNNYKDEGVSFGAKGVIIEVYHDEAYEVEFSREDGTTIAWFAVRQDEVEPVTETSPDLVHHNEAFGK